MWTLKVSTSLETHLLLIQSPDSAISDLQGKKHRSASVLAS
jgi:hypothetical protein